MRESLLRDAREDTYQVGAHPEDDAYSKPVADCASFPFDRNQQGVAVITQRTCDPRLGGWPEWLGKPDGGSLSLTAWAAPSREPGVIRIAAFGGPKPDLSRLVVTVNPLEREQAELNSTTSLLTSAVVAMTAIVAASAWFAAGRVLRPMEAIRLKFADLSAHHLDQRVPLPQGNNEITRLAHTMNSTLDRLQTTVEEQRRFTADASHELRTPLASLRAELEIALAQPRNADWPEVVRGALGDTVRLQHLTTDLLLLARLDPQDAARLSFQPVDLAGVVRQEAVRRRPPSRLTLAVHTAPEPLRVHGAPMLLTRVLANLLDNAERHATSTVTIRLAPNADGDRAVLNVLDDGPGIPVEHRSRVFDRFTRLDAARTRDAGGSGLGLPIAHRIATAHHGTLGIVDSPHGAHFRATFPLHRNSD
ncbi:ATP-binding protein [Streptomyces sp. NBC_00868]|uniref:sensor histidine kinase n=1 Tax=unclassified Streptomyces TaxID=2593676 RepID=UPI00324A0FEC|nr:ATP-binding protein [Streptomyces sp. NBC_00868]